MMSRIGLTRSNTSLGTVLFDNLGISNFDSKHCGMPVVAGPTTNMSSRHCRYSMAVREELLASLRAPASRPGVWAYRHDQDLAVTVRIRLHRHVADNHAPWCLTSRCPRKLIGASRRNARERGGQLALIRMPLRTSGRAVGTVAR